jgi:hypothetical protein
MLSVRRLPQALRRSCWRPIWSRPRAFRDGSSLTGKENNYAKTGVGDDRQGPAGTGLGNQQIVGLPSKFTEFIKYSSQTTPGATEASKEEAKPTGNSQLVRLVPTTRDVSGAEETQLGESPAAKYEQERPRGLKETLSTFLPSYARSRADLSQLPELWTADDRSHAEDASTFFRANTGLRKLLVAYMEHIEPLLSSEMSPGWWTDEATLLSTLETVFDAESQEILDKSSIDPASVAAWAWIFGSANIELAVARYVEWSKELRESESTRKPLFIVLQLLRAERMSAVGLRMLIGDILADLQVCLHRQNYSGWAYKTRVCLVVRLLRHARRVAPGHFVDIAHIIKHLFLEFYITHDTTLDADHASKLALLCNRLLSLVSLPPATSAFNSYGLQQELQLNLVRLMFEFKPRLSVNREGYRALIAVQLLHRKTPEEHRWAATKSLAWPPWRTMTSGIELDMQYPGADSRVIKLIRRMQQAGYTLGAWDKSAAVLAGWDTDGSPTIQTRALLRKQRLPWLLSSRDQTRTPENTEPPEIWSARIRATRTLREAWASFLAYEKALESAGQNHFLPWYSMLERLLAGQVQAGSPHSWKYQPGDLKEVFDDSQNPREVIYIESEIPSMEEYYQRMLRAGIKPCGYILAALFENSPSLSATFQYLQDSCLNEVTKDVLWHAEKHSVLTIRHSVHRVPRMTLAAFVGALCRHTIDREQSTVTFSEIGVIDYRTGQILDRPSRPTFASAYAAQLLAVAKVHDIRLWNAWLVGAYSSLKSDEAMYHVSQGARESMWRQLHRVVLPSQPAMGNEPDLETFKQITNLVLRLSVPLRKMRPDSLQPTRLAFTGAVYGQARYDIVAQINRPLLRIPGVDDLKLLIRAFFVFHDGAGLVSCVKFVNTYATSLRDHHMAQVRERGHKLINGHDSLSDIICSLRLFLEGPEVIFTTNALGAQSEGMLKIVGHANSFVEEARTSCSAVAWPSDVEVQNFAIENSGWVQRTIRAAQRWEERPSVQSEMPVSDQQEVV